MTKFILGRKLNMTQKFQEDGTAVAVTAVEAGPCQVVQVKGDKDGYKAVQVGFGTKSKLSKSLTGHMKDLNKSRYLREFRVDSTDSFAKGKVFDVSSFAAGDMLKVSAVSKGKGFQGVVKRHGFHGAPATHGHKDQERMPGSIGATDAARVFKGTRMGGRMGTDTVTVDHLELIEVDSDKNILYIKGAVPGARNSFVKIVADGELTFVEPKKAEPKTETKKEEKLETKKEEVKKPAVEEDKKEDKKTTTEKKEKPAVDKKVEVKAKK